MSFMKKWMKIAIIGVLLLSIAGIYYGKNIYAKREGLKDGYQQETIEIAGIPTLLEISTST
jgi:hypothetical protein